MVTSRRKLFHFWHSYDIFYICCQKAQNLQSLPERKPCDATMSGEEKQKQKPCDATMSGEEKQKQKPSAGEALPEQQGP